MNANLNIVDNPDDFSANHTVKRIGVLTSGGDAPGMNAAIRAVIRTAIYFDMEIYGIERGYEGLIEGSIKQLDTAFAADILQRGGTILKTARSDDFKTAEGKRMAYSMLNNFGIDNLVIIGGDGSLRGALELADMGINVMGIPATIDNDLAYTDFTIGFDTAINTVLTAISNIRDTSTSHDRTTIIEVMGRECGDIALYAGLTGGAESILIPEEPLDLAQVARKLVQGRNRGKKHNIIIKAEGVDISSSDLADLILENTGIGAKIVMLGYLQRGGSPTARDRMIASLMGMKAVELINEGAVNRAVAISGDSVVDYPLEEIFDFKRKYNEEILAAADILSI